MIIFKLLGHFVLHKSKELRTNSHLKEGNTFLLGIHMGKNDGRSLIRTHEFFVSRDVIVHEHIFPFMDIANVKEVDLAT